MTASPIQSPPTLTLREALRAATEATHAALDGALMPEGATWTEDRYVRFLRGSLAVLSGAEGALARSLAEFAEAGRDSRSQRLLHDLAALGDTASVAAVSIDADLTVPSGAFGAAYVIEGSMLGGQHVARALDRDLGLDGRCLTYLRPSGVAVGRRWSAFVAALDGFGADATAAEWHTAAGAACATFEAFAVAFRREGLL